MTDLEKILNSPDLAREMRPQTRVMVALRSSGGSRSTLARLEKLGLSIVEVVAGTVIGDASAQAVTAIRQDPDVAGVEYSHPLGKHA
jgi:hypothetical protein